jgi:hypothetical protein
MRIHSDTLTMHDIYDACRKAKVYAPVLENKGSRKRDRAFEVSLSGSSSRPSQSHGEPAATWDEWGVFFAHLFYRDPNAFIGQKHWNYDGLAHFDYRTGFRFVWRPDTFNYMPSDTHPQHKWRGDGTGEGQFCTKCTAILRWS